MHPHLLGKIFRCTEQFWSGIFDALNNGRHNFSMHSINFGEKNRCTEPFQSTLFDAVKVFQQQFSMQRLATSALKMMVLKWISWVCTWGEIWTGTSTALILSSRSQIFFNAVVGVYCIEKCFRLDRGVIYHLGFQNKIEPSTRRKLVSMQ